MPTDLENAVILAGGTPSGTNPRDLLDGILLGKRADLGLESLKQSAQLDKLLPEVSALVGFGGSQQGHKNLWHHVKQVVVQTPAKVHLRWAALYHDVGKVKCFRNVDGKISFHGHEAVSARLWMKTCRRTGWFNSEMTEQIRFLVEHLGHVESYESSWTDSAVRRVAREVGDYLNDLVILSRADQSTVNPAKRAANHHRMDEFQERVRVLALEDSKPKPRKGLGTELASAMGLSGPELGKVMKAVQAAVESGKLSPDAPVEVIVEWLKNE